jgi:hypothetical protein
MKTTGMADPESVRNVRRKQKAILTPWLAGLSTGVIIGAVAMWFYLHDVLVPRVSIEPGNTIYSIMPTQVSELSYRDPTIYVQAHRWKSDENFTIFILRSNGQHERCSPGAEFIKLVEEFSDLKVLKVQPVRDSDEKQMQGLLSYRMYPNYNIEPFEIAVLPGKDMKDKLKALYYGKYFMLNIDTQMLQRLKNSCKSTGFM